MLEKVMKLMTMDDSIFVKKPDGTRVNYYIDREFEVHYNQIPAQTTQGWHRHIEIEEVIFVISGSLIVETAEKGKKNQQECKMGDCIKMNSSIHRILNVCEEDCNFIVFRFVPQGVDNREKIKNDKVEFSDDEIETM